jgi:hypothetical protein
VPLTRVWLEDAPRLSSIPLALCGLLLLQSQ